VPDGTANAASEKSPPFDGAARDEAARDNAAASLAAAIRDPAVGPRGEEVAPVAAREARRLRAVSFGEDRVWGASAVVASVIGSRVDGAHAGAFGAPQATGGGGALVPLAAAGPPSTCARAREDGIVACGGGRGLKGDDGCGEEERGGGGGGACREEQRERGQEGAGAEWAVVARGGVKAPTAVDVARASPAREGGGRDARADARAARAVAAAVG